jgi:hypothetical protein
MQGATKTDNYPLYDSRPFPVQVDALLFHSVENDFCTVSPLGDEDTPIPRSMDKFVQCFPATGNFFRHLNCGAFVSEIISALPAVPDRSRMNPYAKRYGFECERI